jgi:hypothetical protein
MAHVMASGKHGRGMGRRRKTQGFWKTDGLAELAGALGLLVLFFIGPPFPMWVLLVFTHLFLSDVLYRWFHHSGDRHHRVATPAEEAQCAAEHTPIKGTVLPTGVIPLETGYELPAYDPPAATTLPDIKRPIAMADRAKVASVVIAFVVTVLAKASDHRLDNARQMQDDIEGLLGIPGKWNNYGRDNIS